MTTSKRLLSLLCTLLLLVQIFPALPLFAAEAPVITYTFANARPGDGEGTLTFTPGSSTTGYYNLYYADENGILPDYEPVVTTAIKSSPVSVKLPQAMLLPPEATALVLFTGTTKAPASTAMENAAAVYELPAEKKVTLGDVTFSFASVSDAHLNYDDSGYGASAKWTAALNFFAEKEMEAVILSGDMTSSGGTTDYTRYQNAIAASNYPASQIYEAQGNHDSQQVARFLSVTSGGDEVHPFAGSAWFYKMFPGDEGEKDNLFIFMAQELGATNVTPTSDNFSAKQLDWVEGLLEEYAGTNTNIFLVEHAVIHNFGPGDRYDGVYVEPMKFDDKFPGNMRLKALLTEYKEVIMMTGHTHLSLYENCNFGDEQGTAARMIHNSSTSQPRSYTSSGSISYDSEGRTTATAGSEGYLAYVYGDYVTYLGHNLTTRKIIPQACFLLSSYSENREDAVSISVTTAPTKTAYFAGDWFSGAGMVVEATYADGSTAPVKGWSVSKVGGLKATDTSVEITYGDCEPVPVAISVVTPSVHGEGVLSGSGTATDPFLIQTAADFAELTKLFNKSTSSSSPCGTGYFYRQTADIDMTGFEGYAGTNASGNGKCYFGGIYDGDGYTLTVAINGAGDASVFPYITGAIINLRMRGSIIGTSAAQPVRTVQAGAVVANCDFGLSLSSSKSSGVCYTNYSVLYNIFTHCTGVNYTVAATNNGSYQNVYQYSFTPTGGAASSSATRTNNKEVIAAGLNDRTTAAAAEGLAVLLAQSSLLGSEALCTAYPDTDGVIFEHLAGSGLGKFAGSGTKDDPYQIGSPREFALLTEYFNASTSSSDVYGTGKYFVQTADIDMTGYAGYEGTHAYGSSKRYFGGHYDGAGHVLTVNISAGSETSIFPYLTGTIINLTFRGSITASSTAQPIRTIQSGAVVANCDFGMTLTATTANPVAYTNYSVIFNVYTHSVATKAVCTTNNGSYNRVWTNCLTASGAPLTSSIATAEADPALVAAGMNDHTSSAAQASLTALAAAGIEESDLLVADAGDGAVFFHEPYPDIRGDVNGDKTVSIQDVTTLLALISGSEGEYSEYAADLNGDGILSIQDVTLLLTLIAG